jgi:hypothetical protein
MASLNATYRIIRHMVKLSPPTTRLPGRVKAPFQGRVAPSPVSTTTFPSPSRSLLLYRLHLSSLITPTHTRRQNHGSTISHTGWRACARGRPHAGSCPPVCRVSRRRRESVTRHRLVVERDPKFPSGAECRECTTDGCSCSSFRPRRTTTIAKLSGGCWISSRSG